MGGTISKPDKTTLRKTAVQLRRRLHAERGKAAGDDLADNCLALFGSAAQGAIVALYWPMCSEIDVRPLMTRLGEIAGGLALPVILGPGRPLAYRLWRPGDGLRCGRFGTSQPVDTAPLARPDIVLTPLLAFDGCGNRLGYGGGYYDRTLRALRDTGPVWAVGVAYDEQEVQCIDVEQQDEKLDAIVTDRRSISIDQTPARGRAQTSCGF